jgi:hypothetical protein
MLCSQEAIIYTKPKCPNSSLSHRHKFRHRNREDPSYQRKLQGHAPYNPRRRMHNSHRRNAQPGFFRRDQLAAVVRSLKISTMYVSKSNALEIPFTFKTYMAQAEEKALVDSSATENFINYKTVA